MAEDNWWSGLPFATAASAQAASPPSGAKTSPQDRKELYAASSQAQAERDARREYLEAAQAVRTFRTGPVKAAIYDALTAEPDGDFFDKVGGAIGALPRAFGWMTPEELSARDHLNTLSARGALKGSQMMKGSSSDKDTALMRIADVSPYKTEAENYRIMSAAMQDSGLAQVRATFKARWIAQHGSLSSPAPGGMTFEEGLRRAEQAFSRPRGSKLPKAPPAAVRARQAAARQPVVIDLNGNPVK